MTDALIFYTNPMSRGRIVRWMLEELGIPYRTELLDYGEAMKSPEYLAINPMGKVPAILHGGTIVTESAAICAYLADAFPDAGLAPTPQSRGAYYRWLFFAAGPLEAALMNRSMGVEPDARQRIQVGCGDYASVMDTLARALVGGSFIADERFTAADVYVGSQIGWGLQSGMIEERELFRDYWVRVSDRDAYRRAAALDDEAMNAAH
ncbi:glutathione S-transferase family protein [Aquisalimonas sp.]|uniref:glutathione S-transferase family protein n=1 Tax=unclassified Aquisalimonas TaxID=2644645 RepID=UPI0025C0D103|nr:glutathione S-transferase family protein [Aquisalimonas sp.]